MGLTGNLSSLRALGLPLQGPGLPPEPGSVCVLDPLAHSFSSEVNHEKLPERHSFCMLNYLPCSAPNTHTGLQPLPTFHPLPEALTPTGLLSPEPLANERL